MRGCGGTMRLWVLAAACAVASGQRPLFDAPLVVLPAGERFSEALDIDADGVADAVTIETTLPSSTFTTIVRLRRGAGFGRFQPPSMTATIGPPSVPSPTGYLARARKADLNGDAYDDFVVLSGTKIGYFFADGAGGAFPAFVRDVGEDVDLSAVGDFDGDGDDDVAVGRSHGFAIVPTDPTGFAVPLAESFFAEPSAGAICAGELTGDGVADLAVAVPGSFSDTTTYVWTFLGGVLASAGTHGIGTFTASTIVSGDLDGDGDVDLLVGGTDAPNVPGHFLIRRYGPSVLGLETTVYPSARIAALADLDGDGDPDGLSTLSNGSIVETSRNDGGVFVAATTRNFLGVSNQEPAVADLDGDGILDLLSGRCTFLSLSPDALGPITVAGLPSTLGALPLGVADFDGDGDIDFDVEYAASATPRRNDGAGAFTAEPLAVPPAPAGTYYAGSALPGDWDGDGDLDLLIERRTVVVGSVGAYVDVRLLKNLGAGDFVDAGPATSAPTRLMFTLASTTKFDRQNAFPADVDGDGDLDLTTSWHEQTWNAAITRVWLNGGAGFFVEGTTQAGVLTFAVIDVNADGKADLVQLGQDLVEPPVGAPASLRLAMGGGTFQQALPLPFTPSQQAGRGAADLDGDGDLDWSYFPNPVDPESPLTIAWGDGAGGYPTSTVVLSGAATPLKAVPFAGDVDADGIVDLVLMGLTTSLVLRGVGGGAYDVDEVFSSPNALLDVDGDGDLDALGGRPARGTRFQGAAGGLRRQYGASWRNAPGQGPVLGAAGPFRAGAVGTLRARRAVGGAPALLAIGVAPMNEPSIVGGDLLVAPVLLLPVACDGPAGAPGEGRLDLPFFAPPEFAGATFYSQLFAFDAASVTGFGVSNGLTITFGAP
jgi:hypothetical protein